MAPTLRYIQKLSGHVISSKHLGLFQHKFFDSSWKQYSSSIQPEYQRSEHRPDTCNMGNTIVDNREVINDVVTRTKVERLVPPDSILCSAGLPEENVVRSKQPASPEGRPSPDKLFHVYTTLGNTLPKLFVQPMDYSIYHENIVFEDNIRKIRTEGLLNYVKQVALLRTIGHIRFAYVRFEVLKITQHPEDGTIRIRWRIRGISAWKVMLMFWKIKLWQWKDTFENSDNWYDGYSTFIVNADGKITKHIADKMMPDSDSVVSENSNLNAAKLALMVTVVPRVSDIALFM
uniref:Uncharacterized protein n=1 Tax=Dendroctonus ponderosae TaxID=77166 RepID=J3JUB3_DENPD|nr:unknown [Dendroctonus ponderosae]